MPRRAASATARRTARSRRARRRRTAARCEISTAPARCAQLPRPHRRHRAAAVIRARRPIGRTAGVAVFAVVHPPRQRASSSRAASWIVVDDHAGARGSDQRPNAKNTTPPSRAGAAPTARTRSRRRARRPRGRARRTSPPSAARPRRRARTCAPSPGGSPPRPCRPRGPGHRIAEHRTRARARAAGPLALSPAAVVCRGARADRRSSKPPHVPSAWRGREIGGHAPRRPRRRHKPSLRGNIEAAAAAASVVQLRVVREATRGESWRSFLPLCLAPWIAGAPIPW